MCCEVCRRFLAISSINRDHHYYQTSRSLFHWYSKKSCVLETGLTRFRGLQSLCRWTPCVIFGTMNSQLPGGFANESVFFKLVIIYRKMSKKCMSCSEILTEGQFVKLPGTICLFILILQKEVKSAIRNVLSAQCAIRNWKQAMFYSRDITFAALR